MLDALSQLQSAMAEAIERGKVERAAEIIRDFEKQYPNFSAVIRAAFVGTPEEVVANASMFWPSLRNLPGAVEFARKLQDAVKKEWTKPRGVQLKRLKP